MLCNNPTSNVTITMVTFIDYLNHLVVHLNGYLLDGDYTRFVYIVLTNHNLKIGEKTSHR